MTKGLAKVERKERKTFTVLDQDDSELLSSTFTLGSETRQLSFEYQFVSPDPAKSMLRVFVLSGTSYSTETLALEKKCPCATDWDIQWTQAQATSFLGADERSSDTGADIVLDDMAIRRCTTSIRPGTAKGPALAWPAVKNYLVFNGFTTASRAWQGGLLCNRLDDTLPPLKRG